MDNISIKKVGREVFFLAAKNGNPRNGEGSFIRLNNGAILFGYTEFLGDDWDDDGNARISSVISYDDGETWSERKVVFEKPDNSTNIMSLSFLRMNNGDIGAFYIIKNGDGTDKIVFTRSLDEAQSWSEPVNCLDCLDVQDYYVLNNDRVLKLKSGRILFAAAKHTIYTDKGVFMPGELCFFYSDDDGATWQKTATELRCPFVNNPDGYEEPGLYELANGNLWCYIRTSVGFQFEAFSNDGGITWSAPEPNLFFSSSCSPMHVKDCGDITAAIFNPVPEHVLRKETLWGRTPYALAISTDKGATFDKENLFYLEDDLGNGYCYPAVIECEGGFLVAYYHSNNSGICLNSTKIVKVMYEELSVPCETVNQYAKTYSDPPERVRIASRGILIDGNKILLSHELNTGVYMSPGGGLEDDETLEECCIRELREETGYEVKPTKHFLTINEYCFETLYVSNYFLCEAVGKSSQALTEIEVEHGITPEWVEIPKALEIFGEYKSKREDIASLYLREYTVLNKLIK